MHFLQLLDFFLPHSVVVFHCSPLPHLTSRPSFYSCFIFPPSCVFSTTVSPCQQCQPGPSGAEKIEPQIEQSIFVRIHQCQTTPSLAVCIEQAHMLSYFD